MQIKTILNHVQKFKSFVYAEARLLADTEQPILEVDVHERRNSWVLCSVCEQPPPSYDRQRQCRFESIPLWGIKVVLLYAPRRVNCSSRFILLKRPGSLTEKQEVKLAELVQNNLRSVRAYLMPAPVVPRAAEIAVTSVRRFNKWCGASLL